MLGLHTIDEICQGWDQSGGFPGLIDHITGAYFGNQRIREGKVSSLVV